jgi:hypothetical protein
MKTAAEILAETKALLSDFKPSTIKRQVSENHGEIYTTSDIRYPWMTKHYLVLAPVGYKWKPVTIDIYTDSPKVHRDFYEPFTLVKHGHEQGKMCFAPDKCHVLGYSPVGNESEVFLKHWHEKWG